MTDTTSTRSMPYLRLIILLALLPYDSLAYPVYGTKRYGRSNVPRQSNWMHVPSYYFQALPRSHPYHTPTYYEIMSPYAPDYDEYYYQDPISYPVYYQPIVPYSYYYSPTYYDGTDPMDDVQEEMLQEKEREQREESLPIGQETWYETDSNEDDTIDDVNAAFMKNLMLYNSALSNPKYEYGKVQEVPDYDWEPEEDDIDDEEVQELKNLNENLKKVGNTKEERMKIFNKNNRNQKSSRYQPNNSENWINYNNKRTLMNNVAKPIYGQYAGQDLTFSSRKPQGGVQGTTEKPATVTTDNNVRKVTPKFDVHGGQKEVVMMRPATPVRRPFSEPVMKLLAKQGGPERKRTPSVYDTIKHMLEMEKNLEKEKPGQNNVHYFRAPMKKRYVSSEESLVEELAGLKKTA